MFIRGRDTCRSAQASPDAQAEELNPTLLYAVRSNFATKKNGSISYVRASGSLGAGTILMEADPLSALETCCVGSNIDKRGVLALRS